MVLSVAALAMGGTFSLYARPDSQLPNIVFILADDLGYGDVGCYNSDSRVPTPNLDQFASEGMRFTDAHSPSTVCTPTRYSLMTGRMEFRTGYRGVFTGVGGPCLIEQERLTLPQMLRERGYTTACFGKWHIGMTFLDKDGNHIKTGGVKGVQQIDYSRAIPDAPIHRGFDHFYGTACCPTTDWLYAYIDGDRIPVPPTKLLDKSQLPKHPYGNDCRRGMVAENFDHEEVDLVFLDKSQKFLEQHVKESPDKPFFLFHSMQAVHLPSFAADQFKGKTEAGPHGDFIFEMDHVVGELLKTLERLGVADNTLVIFGSDNGPEVPTVLDMRKTHQHDGARPWRGVKRDQWEGGHRTPFIVRWPGKIKAGTTSDQLTSLTDVMATCAAISGARLPDDAAEDSYNMLPVLLSTQGDKPVRRYLLQQTMSLAMSIRDGQWKYLDHKGSGGNNYQRDGAWGMKPYALENTDPEAPGQLYDLKTDPGETNNLYSQHPEKVKELKSQLELFRNSGRSAPVHKLSAELPERDGAADDYRRVLTEADPKTNKFLNQQRAEFLGVSYRVASTKSEKFLLFHQSADEFIKAGEIGKGLRRLDSLLTALPTEGRDQIRDAESALRWSQMIGGLRLGEQDNCVAMHGPDSCLFPITGSGVHVEPRGMLLAIENLDWFLVHSPQRLDLRWLRNLTSMALGDWPEGVPEQFRMGQELFASPSDVGRFPDVAPQVGLATMGLCGGASLEDFNGDGYLDLFVSSWGPTDPVHYFENNGTGQFEDKTAAMGLAGVTGGLNLTHADYDNDGDPDVLILRGAWLGVAGHHPNTLLRNDGAKFTDVTEFSGILSFHPTQTADWGDYDRDGDLDLFIGNESGRQEVHPCELFENQGDGTFVEVAEKVGLQHAAYVKGVAWGDIDNDGDLDLYLSTMGSSNVLYENLGPASEEGRPRFRDITARATVGAPLLSFPTWFWDYDQDGRLDILAGSYGSFEESMLEGVAADYLGLPTADEGIRLYRNRGEGRFEEVSEKTEIRRTVLPMGANFGDLDGDGWLDAYFGTGQPDLATLVPNRMFRNVQGQRFEDVTSSGGFGHLQKGHGIAFGDIDHDGDQDIFATMGGAYEGDGYANVLFENPGHGHRWLTLRLSGTKSSRDARHARVRIEVKTESEPRTIHRVVGTGGSFGASSSQLEVGLGAATAVIAVTVDWPVSGSARYQGFSLDRIYSIEEGQTDPTEVKSVPFKLGAVPVVPPAQD